MSLVESFSKAEEPIVKFRTASEARKEVPELGYLNYWYPAVPSRTLRNKPLAIRLLGQDIVLYRSRGKVCALQDRCAHRGLPLSIGKVRFPGTITCPYHGWTFNGEGACVAVLTEGPQSKIPGKARVRTYPVEERADTVWVFVGDMEPPPVETDIPEDLFRTDQLVFSLGFTWQANWRLAMENVADPSHGQLLHRTSLRYLFRKYRAKSRLQAMDNEQGDGFFIDLGVRGELERARTEFPGVGKFPKQIWWRFVGGRESRPPLKETGNMQFMSEIKLPGYLRVINPWFLLQWSVPVDATSSRQYCWILRRARGLKAVCVWLYWHLWYKFVMRQFLGQDRWVTEAQQAADALSQPEKLSVNDTGVIHWRRLASQARQYQGANIR